MAKMLENPAELLQVSPLRKAQHYKVELMMELKRLSQRLKVAMQDSGIRSSLIFKCANPHRYWNCVKEPKWSRFGSVAGTSLKVVERITLLVRSSQQLARIGILRVENLAVDILLGTAFIDESIKSVFPKCDVLVPMEPSPAMTQVDAMLAIKVLRNHSARFHEEQEPVLCSVEKQKENPQPSKALVSVQTKIFTLKFLSSYDRLMHRTPALAVHGVVTVVSNRPFAIKVANQSKGPMTLPKKMVMTQCF